MDTRVGEFIQRTFQKYGAPWKVGKRQRPEPSQIPGHPCQPLLKKSSKRKFQSQSQSDSPSSSQTEVNAVRNAAVQTESLQDRHNTVCDTAVQTEEFAPTPGLIDAGSSRQTGKVDLQRSQKSTQGPSRNVTSSEDTKECLTILLTSDMITGLNRVLGQSRNLERLQADYEEARRSASIAQSFMEYSNSRLETLEDVEQINQIRMAMEEREPQLLEDTQRRDFLEGEVRVSTRNLEYARNQTESKFEELLDDAKVLDLPEAMKRSDHGGRITNDGLIKSMISGKSESLISADALYLRTIDEEVQQAAQALDIAQQEFDSREEDCAITRERYQKAVDAGTCHMPQSEFERITILTCRELADDLRNAEAVFESAVGRARALGLVENTWEQTSNFVDCPDDGYRMSFEAEMAASPDLVLIDAWAEKVVHSRPLPNVGLPPEDHDQEPEYQEADDWPIAPVEMWGSRSQVEEEEWKWKHIHAFQSYWQEMRDAGEVPRPPAPERDENASRVWWR